VFDGHSTFAKANMAKTVYSRDKVTIGC